MLEEHCKDTVPLGQVEACIVPQFPQEYFGWRVLQLAQGVMAAPYNTLCLWDRLRCPALH